MTSGDLLKEVWPSLALYAVFFGIAVKWFIPALVRRSRTASRDSLYISVVLASLFFIFFAIELFVTRVILLRRRRKQRIGLHCPHCDYDLRNLGGASVCPECGQPFDPASRAKQLRRPFSAFPGEGADDK